MKGLEYTYKGKGKNGKGGCEYENLYCYRNKKYYSAAACFESFLGLMDI